MSRKQGQGQDHKSHGWGQTTAFKGKFKAKWVSECVEFNIPLDTKSMLKKQVQQGHEPQSCGQIQGHNYQGQWNKAKATATTFKLEK